MPLLIRLALVWLIVVTSLSLGMARGQLRTGAEVVLCSGSAIVTDADHPAGARYCPDMATGLLVALDPPPVVIAPVQGQGRRIASLDRTAPVPPMRPVPQARGPPPLTAA